MLLKDTRIYVIHALQGYDFHEKYVQSLFAKYNLDFEFVYDGDPSLIDKITLQKYFREDFLEKASVGGISCTLNHFYAYIKLVDSESEYAIIFENDPCFLKGFNKNILRVYNEMIRLDKGFIISLENTTLRFPSYFQMRKNRVLYRARGGRMAGAYIIDRTGAYNALKDLQENKCADIVDWWHNRLVARNILRIYWAHPPLVEQGSHNGLMSSAISSKKKSVYRRMSWLLQKYYKMYFRRFFYQKRIMEV